MFGEVLLTNGAEISRVQDTMERVAKAYDGNTVEVYVLTNAIFANGTENGIQHSTVLKYIKNSRIHLGRISAANQLSREIAKGNVSIEEAFRKIKEISDMPYTPLPVTTICCTVTAACYSILFGGSPFDALAAAICGVFLEPLLFILEKYRISKFLSNLISSAFVAFLACLIFAIGLGDNLDKIIIGTIIRLVPGVALTTSIRDFLSGDYLSGTIRLIDALIIGVCIGIGVGFVIMLWSALTGSTAGGLLL